MIESHINSGRRVMAIAVIVLAACAQGCTRREGAPAGNQTATGAGAAMNRTAESYVKLVLGVGQHDADYVDAYYGPAEWQAEAKEQRRPLDQIKQEANELMADLDKMDLTGQEEMAQLRHKYLVKQLQSLVARVEMLGGKRLTFDEESRALYDAVAPTYSESHFKEILGKLEPMLPGSGPLVERYERFKRDFIIPKEKLDTVFKAAIEEARRRTRQHIELPANESFVLEYVTGKSWSGYNWYKGNAHSLIQINTDLPIYIDRAIDLASHEGYPGHHVYNVLLEQRLVKDRGWVEFSVYPLYSPQSLIAEGSANYGIEVAFPGATRIEFERASLFSLAGIDPARADGYYAVHELAEQLSYAGNEAARRYLNGEINADQAAYWLATYALMPMERARQRVRFFDQYRSYVINYNLGQDLVKNYIESKGGTSEEPAKRWQEFMKLLASPRLPSGLN